jgi:hypothetical protein
MKRVLVLWFVLALLGCGPLDAFDGEAETVSDCCWLWPNIGAVDECVRASVDDGLCHFVTCDALVTVHEVGWVCPSAGP